MSCKMCDRQTFAIYAYICTIEKQKFASMHFLFLWVIKRIAISAPVLEQNTFLCNLFLNSFIQFCFYVP